jgi:hypothetical protein
VKRFRVTKRSGTQVRHARLRRVLGALSTVGAIGALTAGLAFGYFTDTGTGTGSATVGSVSLAVNSPATTTCSYTNLLPGDLTGTETCALSVSYTGTGTAYVSLTIAVQSNAGSGVGAKTLFDPNDNDGLLLSITDGTSSFSVPTGSGTTAGCTPMGSTCWTESNDLAAWYSSGPSTAHLAFTSTSPAVTWTVTPLFTTTVGNAYQGASATLTLTATAVQTEGNTLPATCTTSTIGLPCAGTWS